MALSMYDASVPAFQRTLRALDAIAEELSVQLLPGAILSAPTLRELAIMVEEFGDGNAARRAES